MRAKYGILIAIMLLNITILLVKPMTFRLAQSHSQQARAFASAGNYAAAVREMNAVVRLTPQSSVAHYDLGCYLDKAGRLPEALAEIREAVRLNPSDAVNYNKLGSYLSRSGHLPERSKESSPAVRHEIDRRPIFLEHRFTRSITVVGQMMTNLKETLC